MEFEPIPISLVAHTAFCPRRAWLEAAGETVPSIAIEQGAADHGAVDSRSDDRVVRRHSVHVAHTGLGLVGRCDVLAATIGGGTEVVEFKSSPLRRRPEVTPPQVIQLALQRLCLEDAGETVTGQSVYFTTHRKTIPVELTAADFDNARAYVTQTRSIIASAAAPPVLVDDPRCSGCSHAGVCLPDERRPQPVRRVLPALPHGDVLHVATPGARASIRSGRLVVRWKGEELRTVPIERVEALVVHGNVDVSSALTRELLWRGSMVLWCSGRGRLVGYAQSARSHNGSVRALQQSELSRHRLALARELVASKISNQATLLRRNSRDGVADAVAHLRRIARTAGEAGTVGSLLGIEGAAAATYFSRFPSLLASPDLAAGWPGRVGRGSQDPLNTSLNLLYSLLLGDVVRAVVACGLDPHVGCVHSASRNKPALALDLMEQFRPVVADSALITAINNGELTPSMFTTVLRDTRLRDLGRRALVVAYERRANSVFTHPTYGYKVTWRRAMEVQARMVLGVLDGTQDCYVGVRVR